MLTFAFTALSLLFFAAAIAVLYYHARSEINHEIRALRSQLARRGRAHDRAVGAMMTEIEGLRTALNTLATTPSKDRLNALNKPAGLLANTEDRYAAIAREQKFSVVKESVSR
tara:strand:- start:127 stop:465 length:339 start_codon:yes stop_codon:yes gene_type:complete